MIRFVWRTDVHCADQSPASRTDDWATTVMDKLTQVGQIAEQVGATAVLDGGDFFNPKTPSRTTHSLVQRIVGVHAAYPCPVFANVGNHDCRHSQISALPESPLGTLFESGVFRRCYTVREEGQVTQRYEQEFSDSTCRVKVAGIPYHGPRYDLDHFRDIEKGEADHLVVMAHVLASPHGGSMFAGEDIIKYSDLVDLNPEVSVWLFGHWHKDQGVTEIAPGKWVVNIGSLTRGSLSQDNVDRKPGVAILTFEGKSQPKIEVQRLKVRPSSEVFDMEKRVREESRSMTMDAFVDEVAKSLEGTVSSTLEQTIENLDGIPGKVKDRALDYMERATKR